MIIDQNLLSELFAQAKTNHCLQLNYDLRNSENDNFQQMINVLEPVTVMPIHRHRRSSKIICMVRGKMIVRLYNDKGNNTDEFVMEPCWERTMVYVEDCQWHSLEAVEEGTIVLEEKDGMYEPLWEEDVMMGK